MKTNFHQFKIYTKHSCGVKTLTLKQIVEGIKSRDNQVLTIIYQDMFPAVRYYVESHGGTEDDAKDVFQETLVILFKQVNTDSFEINTGFEAYLYGIARKIWLKILRDRDTHNRNITYIEEPEITYNQIDELIEEDFRKRLYRKYFLQLPEECQKVLSLIFKSVTYEKIAKKLGYKSEKIVRNKKYKCKETLLRDMSGDPDFESLKFSDN